MRLRRALRPPGAPEPATATLESACFAPHSALYFQPDGRVAACCTSAFAAGHVTGPERRTLQEIWDGAQLADQRAALERDDFDLGCQECAFNTTVGGRLTSLASHFDRFAAGAPHAFPKLIDFALSNRCNLQCVMCNGGLSSSIRAKREQLPPLPSAYDDQFFDELSVFLPHAERLHFKGGEPFLARENRRIWDQLIDQGLHPEVKITTNGTIFNERVEHYLTELRVHPIISVDGTTPEVLESIRVGVESTRFWSNVDRIQAVSAAVATSVTLSFCLVQSNWREVLPFLREAERRGVWTSILFVNQPDEHDVLRLPHDELVAIHRELAAAPVGFDHRPDLAQEWATVLGRFREQIERPVTLTIRAPEPRSTDAAAQAQVEVPSADPDAIRALLAAAHQVDPVELDTVNGQVTHVRAQPWSDWFAPGGWTGLRLDELEHRVAQHTGASIAISAVACDLSAVDRLAIEIDHPIDGRRTLWSHVLDTGGRPEGVVMVVPAPAP
ncbi:MAG: Molybdenum cofactor biosynthesis enzyme [Ilumatobacteraceae bacterium]|nr:Molybdenum cofactor biosynthesis enzyme [Ilumatobacteraceae bacterium]